MSHNQDFYRNIVAFSDFSHLSDDVHFAEVPDSWCVVLTDVRGSTKAIQEGRYKDVNLIGAASVTCVLNALETYEIPFVFGGDGATLLISKEYLEDVKKELENLQSLAQREFNLELRVGIVPVSTLRTHGADLRVGKYQLSPGNVTAQFKGTGLTLAEEMIKKGKPGGATMIAPPKNAPPPKLEGLSCRLSSLDTKKGKILSILIKPKTPDTLNYVLKELRRILNDDFMTASPVSSERLRWDWPPATLRSEVALRGETGHLVEFLKTAFITLVLKICITWDIPIGGFKPGIYKKELVTNSDFKKFDETLRMVIDCTQAQDAAIEALLTKLSQEDKIVFGLHRSAQAIVTCMVKSASQNRHIHFVDGGDGGYALAAVQLKKNLSR